jgi:hypothetical protein
MIPSTEIASKADFNSAAAELLVAPEFVFKLVGAFVHASAKLSTAANETIAWTRFFILDRSSIPLLDLITFFYAETGVEVKLSPALIATASVSDVLDLDSARALHKSAALACAHRRTRFQL